jgi:hypothetical protein
VAWSTGRRAPAIGLLWFLALVGLAGAACGGDPEIRAEELAGPSVGPATPVAGQPPVVWVAGQMEEVSGARVVLVEPDGPRVRLQRLAGGATRFFGLQDGGWRRMEHADIELIEAGTPLCVEVFLDDRAYLALRVFVGAACGPRN